MLLLLFIPLYITICFQGISPIHNLKCTASAKNPVRFFDLGYHLNWPILSKSFPTVDILFVFLFDVEPSGDMYKMNSGIRIADLQMTDFRVMAIQHW